MFCSGDRAGFVFVYNNYYCEETEKIERMWHRLVLLLFIVHGID